MNINDYKYIVTIAELGSFTKAAQELFIAQPSLSQRVKHIEEEYEIHIFLRDKKGIQLTPEGEVFVKYANRILQNEDDLKKTIYDMHNTENKPLRVGIPQFINTPFFKQLIRTYHKDFPLYQLEFLENTSLSLQQQLLSGEIDLAICYLPVSSPDIKYEVIINDNIVLVPAVDGELSHKIKEAGFSSGDTIDVHFLDGEPLAMAPSGTMLNNYAQSLAVNEHIHLNIRQTCKNFTLLYNLAKDGISTTILDESFFDPKNDTEIPYYYLDSIQDNCLSVAVAWRKGAYLNYSAKNFILTARSISNDYADLLSAKN